MGFFKKVLGGIGNVAKFAAPVLAFTPIGAPIAAGIGIAGGLAGQLNNKNPSLKKGLLEGAASGGSAYALGGGNGKAGLGWGGKVGNFLTGSGGGGALTDGTGLSMAGRGLMGGMTGYDRASLLLGGLGAAAGAYGSYQEGQGADEDRALAQRQWESEFGRQTGLDTEDKRRWDTDFGEDTRRYDQDFAEDTRRYGMDFGENQRQFDVTTGEGVRRFDLTRGDERADVEYERDLMRQKGRAVSPFVGRLLKLGAA